MIRFIPSVLIAGLCVSCVSDAPPVQRQPSEVRPVKLIPVADGIFADTDANRFRDTSRVVVYIMGDVPGYRLPIAVAGEFVIRLETRSGMSIAEWRFDQARTAEALHALPPGPGYVFDLDLRTARGMNGTDRTSETEADLVATFIPKVGEQVRVRTTAPILVGSVSRGDR